MKVYSKRFHEANVKFYFVSWTLITGNKCRYISFDTHSEGITSNFDNTVPLLIRTLLKARQYIVCCIYFLKIWEQREYKTTNK